MEKNRIKLISKSILQNTKLFKSLCKRQLFVFNYHDVTPTPAKFSLDFDLNVSPNVFLNQISWIKKYFNVIAPHELMSGDYDLPAALITFDDGFQSAFKYAANILEKERLTGTVFMNMEVVEGEVSWSALLTYLWYYDKGFKDYIYKKYKVTNLTFLSCSKEDTDEYLEYLGGGQEEILEKTKRYQGYFASKQELGCSDGVFLGSHLYNHFNAVNLSKEALERQYKMNYQALCEYKNSMDLFSYPFGQPNSCYNADTHDILQLSGAKKIFSAYAYPNFSHNPLLIHRISMFNNINSEIDFRFQCLFPSFKNYILNFFSSKNINHLR